MNRWTQSIVAVAIAVGSVASAAAVPPAGGTISITVAQAADDAPDPATPSFITATSDALAAKGFTILEDPGHAAYVAELILTRTRVGTGSAKASGGSGVTAMGMGVSIPFSTGNSRLVSLQRTQFELRIHKQGDAAILWRGAAVTIRADGTRNGADDVVAAALSQAALGSYPTVREDIVGVP